MGNNLTDADREWAKEKAGTMDMHVLSREGIRRYVERLLLVAIERGRNPMLTPAQNAKRAERHQQKSK